MGRLARVVLPGVVHHITQRGVRSMEIFFEDYDRSVYLSLLKEQGNRVGL
jgi:putative transposase